MSRKSSIGVTTLMGVSRRNGARLCRRITLVTASNRVRWLGNARRSQLARSFIRQRKLVRFRNLLSKRYSTWFVVSELSRAPATGVGAMEHMRSPATDQTGLRDARLQRSSSLPKHFQLPKCSKSRRCGTPSAMLPSISSPPSPPICTRAPHCII